MVRPYLLSLIALGLGGGLTVAQEPVLGGENLVAPPPAAGIWARAEYLHWWRKREPLPQPLLTTDLTGGFGTQDPGFLGNSTVVVFGGTPIGFDGVSGGRFTAGTGLGEDFGVEATYLFLGDTTRTFAFSSNGAEGSPILFRPLVNLPAGNFNGGVYLAFPGALSGAFTFQAASALDGAELNLTATLLREEGFRLEGLAGFRYLSLRESLRITDRTTLIPPNGLATGAIFGPITLGLGDTLSTLEGFAARNNFYGGQVGVRTAYELGAFGVEVSARVALGRNRQTVAVTGSSTLLTAAGGVSTLPGGLLAVGSNTGQFRRDALAVIPELGVKLSYDVAGGVRAWAGYDFLYWNRAARAGNLTDVAVDTRQSPQFGGGAGAAALPAPPLGRVADFWAQGVNAGVEFRY